jgi:hypothetical protein
MFNESTNIYHIKMKKKLKSIKQSAYYSAMESGNHYKNRSKTCEAVRAGNEIFNII